MRLFFGRRLGKNWWAGASFEVPQRRRGPYQAPVPMLEREDEAAKTRWSWIIYAGIVAFFFYQVLK